MQPDNQGYKAILTVTNEGFKLNAAVRGEILRRGTDTDVFTIYDSMLIDVRPLLVKDGLKDVTMSFDEYEQFYGYGRVERDDPVRFLLYTETTEEYTVIGIEERHRKNVISFHSIYLPYEMSRKDKAKYAAQYVYDLLYANETGNITAVGVPGFHKVTDVRIYNNGYAPRFGMAKQLYYDALERKTTITEILTTKQEVNTKLAAEDVKEMTQDDAR